MDQPVTYAFNGHRGLVIVYATLSCPNGQIEVRLAADTGAIRTTINKVPLISIGYAPDNLPQTMRLLTANGSVMAPLLTLNKIESLAHERQSFPVVAHTMTFAARVDGVLGLDFFRRHTLTLDFSNGEIRLA